LNLNAGALILSDIERIFKTSGDASQFYELIGKFNDLRFRREEKHSRLESGKSYFS